MLLLYCQDCAVQGQTFPAPSLHSHVIKHTSLHTIGSCQEWLMHATSAQLLNMFLCSMHVQCRSQTFMCCIWSSWNR